MGNFLENLFAKRNAKDNSAQIAQQMQPLVQKANVRNVQNLQAGRINRDQYQKQSNNILGAWQDNSVKQLDNGLVVNTKKNNGFETALTGLSSGIMSIAPQRIAGSIAEYGGTVLGNDKIRDFGRKLDQPFRDYGAVQNEQASNKLLYGGANLAGSLLTLPIAPTKGATAFRAVQYGAPQAADTASAIRDGGGGRVAQILGGGVTGAISGTLGVKGAESILNPKDQLAKTLAGRVFKAGNYEGLENAVQSGVDSLVAKNTYNKDLSLGQAAKDALTQYGMGFAGGGLVRGGMEVAQVGNRPRVPLTPELQNKRDILANGYTKAMDMGKPAIANDIARQINNIDNPPKGSLREKIRSAKNTVVEAYKKEMLLPGEPGAKKQGGFIGSGDTNPLESLKQEALKYKTAEEFVDSKINSYHQTDAKFDKFENTNQPFRFSGANFFLDTKPPKTLKKYLVEANTNLKNPLVIEDGNITQPMVDKAIKDGYDGIINKLPEGNGFPKRNEIAVFNPETIQTRQQLTDLYNQATQSQPPKAKPSPLESLKQEARKLDEQVRSYDTKKNFRGFRESDDARKLVELESKLQESNKTISRLENPVDKVTVSQIENMGRKAILEGNVSKADLVKQFNKMGKEKFPSNQKRYIDDTYGSVEAYYDDVIAKGEAGIVEQYSQFAEMPTSPQFEDFYSRTVLNRNKTGLNGNEPKINKVERKITETEPKRTEKATQSQPPKSPLTVEKKPPIPDVKDVNGVKVKEGDTIEFASVMGDKMGRSKVAWVEGSMKNDGTMGEGAWVGNGSLDNGLPFRIVNDKKPTLQDALEGKSAKPFTPISQPVDNIPDFAKRVVDSQAKTKTQSKKQQSAVLSQEVSNNQPLAVSSDSNIPPVANDVQSILQGKQVKNKTLQERIATNDRYPQPVKDMLNGTYVAKDNKTTIKDAKNLIRTDRTAAEARALNPQNAVDMAINAELFNHYVDTGNHTKAMEFINSTGDTNLGQMVQILSQYDKTTPQGSVKFAQKAIEKYNKANPNKALSLSETDVKSLVSKAQEVHAMPEGRARNIASQQLITQVNDLIPSTLADKALAVWKAGLLTSPRTTMRNLIGNTVHGITETVKDAPAALNDMLLAGKTGDRSLTFTTKGALSGAKEGFKSGSDMMKFGFDPTQAIDKYDVRHVTWGKNPVEQGLKKYTDFVFHAMGAQDQPFYHSAFARSLYDQAGAQAINAGQRGNKAFIENLVKNPTESMKKIATQDASVATFKDPNILKSMAGQIKNQANKNEITKVISEVVMPFTGVPSSIAGQMAAYSPIGLAKGIVNDARVLSGSKVAGLQRKASQEIGRGIIGTGLMGLGAYLTAQGLMTGNPKDADEAKQWQLEGKQANSVLIGGKWRSINSVGPEALVALAGSKIQAGKQNGDGAGAIAGNLGKDFTSQTFLAGVQGPLQAVSDPARYGGTYTKGMASSIVPNIVKDTSKAFDPTQREVNSVSDALKASLPGFRNTLLPKRDALGNPLKQEPTGAGAFIDLFNSKTPIKNPVVDELSRLYKSGNSATPSTLSKNQTILGEKVKLDPKQLDQLEQSTGQPITQQFNQLMATPEYKGASDEIKKKSLDKIVQDVRDQAKLNLGGGTAGTTNTPNSVVNLSKISSDAQMTLAKDSFDKSGKSYQIIGDTVLRRSADGVISATPKIKFDNQINTATLAKQKASDDLKGWMSTAETQLKNIDSQLADPSIDPLEAIQLQNDAQSLLDNIEKYTKYGGFKKGKSGRKSSAEVARNKLATATLSMNNNTLSSLKSLDALLAGTRTPSSAKAKTVAVRKPTLKQIKVRA